MSKVKTTKIKGYLLIPEQPILSLFWLWHADRIELNRSRHGCWLPGSRQTNYYPLLLQSASFSPYSTFAPLYLQKEYPYNSPRHENWRKTPSKFILVTETSQGPGKMVKKHSMESILLGSCWQESTCLTRSYSLQIVKKVPGHTWERRDQIWSICWYWGVSQSATYCHVNDVCPTVEKKDNTHIILQSIMTTTGKTMKIISTKGYPQSMIFPHSCIDWWVQISTISMYKHSIYSAYMYNNR